jgi:hypothetical protein
MTLPTPPTNRVGELTRRLLDRGYETATRASLDAIGASTNDGLIAQRLRELAAEAERLAAAGQRLTVDNAVLRALQADLDPVLAADRRRLAQAATQAQTAGTNAAGVLTRELALPGVSDAQLRVIGVRWNVPDPEAVNALVGYTNSTGWAQELDAYGPRVQEVIRNQSVRGVVEGWSPIRTAREITRMAQDFPRAQAETLARTVQLTSYRDAAVIHRMANADILTEQIRVAALDDRTCMACVALHGTRLPIDARIDDHHNGRCTSISVVRGRPRSVESGETWFENLSPSQQRAQMGDAAWLAWQEGKLRLRDLARTYRDPVFGQMVGEASLSGVLGDGAREYVLRARSLR